MITMNTTNPNFVFLDNVPLVPTMAMTDGLVRDILRGLDLGCSTGTKLKEHLGLSGYDLMPDWLSSVLERCPAHLDKATRAFIIFSACMQVHLDEGQIPGKPHYGEMQQRMQLKEEG